MSSEIKDLFSQYIDISDSFRKGYKNSLGEPQNENMLTNLPHVLKLIYSIVKGTSYEVKDQSLMDFLPGYLLIDIEEYAFFKKKLNNILEDEDKGLYFPLLVNYSSDFYAIKKNDNSKKNEIFLIEHDDLPVKLHNSLELFLKTLILCYKKGAYFTDKDGYLDVDFDKEEAIGQTLNPDVEYWFDG